MAWREKLQQVMAGLGNGILPTAQLTGMGLDPMQAQVAQQAAVRQFGLGMLSNIGTGNSFGQGLGSAVQFANQNGIQSAQMGLTSQRERDRVQREIDQASREQSRWESDAAYRASRAAAQDAQWKADNERAQRESDALAKYRDGSLANERAGLAQRRYEADQDYKARMAAAGAAAAGAAATAPKTPAEIQRMNIAMASLTQGLNAYETMLKEFNPRSWDQLDPAKRASVESLLADLRMQYKEAAALGALTGPDLAILDKALADPTSFKGAIFGKDGLSEQLRQSRLALGRRKTALDGLYAPAPGAIQRPVVYPNGSPEAAAADARAAVPGIDMGALDAELQRRLTGKK